MKRLRKKQIARKIFIKKQILEEALNRVSVNRFQFPEILKQMWRSLNYGLLVHDGLHKEDRTNYELEFEKYLHDCCYIRLKGLYRLSFDSGKDFSEEEVPYAAQHLLREWFEPRIKYTYFAIYPPIEVFL